MRHVGEAIFDARAQLAPRHVEEPVREVRVVGMMADNHAETQVRVHGTGVGRHLGSFRLERDGRFSETRTAEWVGDHHRFDVPFVASAVIAVIDGSDEIRSN
jgi:hypothetical protein